jgi:hypothetical protein
MHRLAPLKRGRTLVLAMTTVLYLANRLDAKYRLQVITASREFGTLLSHRRNSLLHPLRQRPM